MDQYIQKIKGAYEKIKNAQTSYAKVGIQPARDWKIILVSSFAIFCIYAMLAFVFYVQVDSGRFFTISDDSVVTEAKINDALFKKTVEEINTRSNALGTLRSNKIAPEDPSL
jgi:hypothetical protein